jgi:hypothetical protein
LGKKLFTPRYNWDISNVGANHQPINQQCRGLFCWCKTPESPRKSQTTCHKSITNLLIQGFQVQLDMGAMVEHNLSSKNTGCILVRCKSTHPLRLLHRNNVRFVLTSSCLYECSCLTYVILVCLRIVVTNTYCVVFLLCFSSSCVQYRGGSAIGKNMIFWRKIVIFHTKYPKNIRASLRSAQFF